MKIAVIDSVCLYNDILQSFITNPRNTRHVGGLLCYVGRYPSYEELLQKLSVYVDKFCPNYFQLHVLISTTTPKLLPGHIIDCKQTVYKNIVRSLKHITNSSFLAVSTYIHEYDKLKTKADIITNIQHSIGACNCDIIPCQYTVVVA